MTQCKKSKFIEFTFKRNKNGKKPQLNSSYVAQVGISKKLKTLSVSLIDSKKLDLVQKKWEMCRSCNRNSKLCSTLAPTSQLMNIWEVQVDRKTTQAEIRSLLSLEITILLVHWLRVSITCQKTREKTFLL